MGEKWKRIKWAVCKKKDLVQFKMDLMAHTESIQLLLTLLQFKSLDLNHVDQRANQHSMISLIQDGFSSCMQRISGVDGVLNTVVAGAQECVEGVRRIMAINVQVFHIVLRLQNLLLSIPGQIERQQPVYFSDALGRYSPFHLEFIRSPEALLSVLSDNFKGLGAGSKKIEDGHFTMHDAISKRDIDLTLPWEQCFMPGQRVEMSMLIKRQDFNRGICPNCAWECEDVSGYDIQCKQCGLTFRGFKPLAQYVKENQRMLPDGSGIDDELLPAAVFEREIPEDDDDLYIYRRNTVD
ncbi:MAG: hypothetical protein Q9174_007357 [Haloplaca sp. 1 TL-2023]